MKQKIIISILLLSFLIIAGCSESTQDAIEKLEAQGLYICAQDSDCAVVPGKYMCACEDAINKEFLDEWNKIPAVKRPENVLCEACPPKPNEAKCVKNACIPVYEAEVSLIPTPEPIPTPDPDPEMSDPEPNEGILRGTAMKTSGNCMPMICDEPPCETSCKNEFVQNKIYVYTAKKQAGMVGEYLAIHSEMDTPYITTPNEDGFFAQTLPIGMYSVFIEHEGKQYCNSFSTGSDGQTYACLVEIKLGEATDFNPKINMAVY